MNRRTAVFAVLLALGLAGAVLARVFLMGEPPLVEIREVWEHHEMYESRSLRVSGTLERFLEGHPKEHYVVESAAGYRIGVEAPGLDALNGSMVTAAGEVTFDEERGLRLESAVVTRH